MCDFRKSVLCITNTILNITLELLIAWSLSNSLNLSTAKL